MRVLRVITRLDVHGGAELSTLIEIEELAARGHDVRVLTLAEATTPAAAARLDSSGISHRHLPGRAPVQAREVRRELGTWSPDVVHAVIFRSELVTAMASIGTQVPSVVSLVNMQYDAPAVAQAKSPRRLELMRRLESTLLQHGIDWFHCLTEAGRRHSVEHLGIPEDRISVIPRGRRRADLMPDAAHVRELSTELGGPPLLLNIGRHELQKGQDLLIEAVRRLVAEGSDVSLAIAGREGNETRSLREQIRSDGLADRVELLGARADVTDLLAAADIVGVTSRWEGLGGSIIESLGAGAAVVAFAVPAVAEVVGDAGLLVEPFDVEAFTDALRGLLADDERRRTLGELARSRFEQRFEIGAVVDQIEHMYERVGSRA